MSATSPPPPQDAFTAWVSDRAAGLDAIMLAPTRELVAELNRSRPRPSPRSARLPASEVRLADGNRASVGDVIITRSNDRRLRLTATDWVKNGDRWTITACQQTRRPHRTAHTAATSPSDSPPTTSASRPASATPPPSTPPKASPPTPCTACSPGRSHDSSCTPCSPAAGSPTTSTCRSSATATRTRIIRPETVAPRTPTETLQQILARDDAPTSATTLLRELSDPAARLFDAVQRYTDGLHVAAEQLVGPQIVQMLDSQADQIVPELTSEPSWPTLRAHLLALAAETGEHPLLHLHAAAAGRELHTAGDMAAVLDWRLPEPAPTDPGPLPVASRHSGSAS